MEAIMEATMETKVRSITAGALATVQGVMTAARKALDVPIALQIEDAVLTVLPYALGKLAKTFSRYDLRVMQRRVRR